MELLARLMRLEALTFLASLIAVVAYRLLLGGIRTQGMLQAKDRSGFDPGRLQMLVVTFVVAMLMLIELGVKRGQLMLPSGALLYLFGGSQGIYLVRKVLQSHFRFLGG